MVGQRVIGYVRCSTTEQAVAGLSLATQTERVRGWCRASGATLIRIVRDEGVSGAKKLPDRLGGRELHDLLSGPKPALDAVVVVRLDRLGRDAAETLALLDHFRRGPVGLVSLSERLDLTTPHGRALAGVTAVFSELERGLIAQRTAEALATLRKDRRAYGPVPYGFERVGSALVVLPEEQSVLDRMRDRRDCGFSYAWIANWLNDQRVPSKRGGAWHAMSVRSVLATSARLSNSETAAPAHQPA